MMSPRPPAWANLATLCLVQVGTQSISVSITTMEPYEWTTDKGISIPGTQGVVEVEINNNIQGADHRTIREAAINAARALFGDLPSQFVYVMLCIPPGTSGGWLAYGKFLRRVLLLWHLRAHERILFSPLSAYINHWSLGRGVQWRMVHLSHCANAWAWYVQTCFSSSVGVCTHHCGVRREVEVYITIISNITLLYIPT
jgi:hypothetical protein